VLHLTVRLSQSILYIISTTIDTAKNREEMPDADKSNWLPPEKIGDLIRAWSDGENRPDNGSFAKLNYKNGCIVPDFI
jgi:hypothetical protein